MASRRKGNPAFPSASASGNPQPLFGASDAARARTDARLSYVAGIDDERVADGLTFAFGTALMAHAIDLRNAAPSERRDYFGSVAHAARRLLDEMGLGELAKVEAAATDTDLILKHGYRHLLNEVPLSTESGPDHSWLARLAREIGPSRADHEAEYRRIWTLPGEPEPSPERIAESYQTAVLSDALERSILGLAYLIAIAERGERRWKARRATRSPDGFRVSLFTSLARLYFEAFGKPPRVKDSVRDDDVPASRWIDAVISIAAANADRAPSFSDDEAAPFDPAEFLRGLPRRWQPETVAEYFRQGWKMVQRIDAKRRKEMNPD